jgi:LEA14-like dessication related protein
MKRYCILFLGTVVCILCTGCASKPVEPETLSPPALSLSFDRIEAQGLDHISLYFLLNAENPNASGMGINMSEWTITLNDRQVEKGAFINLEKLYLESGASGTFPGRIELDKTALNIFTDETDFSEYELKLRLEMDAAFADGDSSAVLVLGETRFPRVREPVFTITSISVMRAELINTCLKVKLRIDNPNVFAVALSSFAYELYGSGRFWADGTVKDVMRIEPQSSTEQELFLIMNFINMKRELLDQIIALQTVRYRLAGNSAVSTGIDYLSQFSIDFDHTGDSPVIE